MVPQSCVLRVCLLGLAVAGLNLCAAQDAWTEQFTAATKAFRKKDYAAAELGFKKAVSLAEAAGSDHQDRLATSLNSLGVLYKAQGNAAEAEKLYERAVGMVERKYGRQHPNTVSLLLNLGTAYASSKKLADAEAVLSRAYQNARASGNDDLRNALILYHLGNVRRERKRFQAAEQDLSRCLYIRERHSRDLSDVGRAVFALALLYKDSGKAQLEESMWRRYLDFREMSISNWDHETVTALQNFAAVLRKNGKPRLAANAQKQAEMGASHLAAANR